MSARRLDALARAKLNLFLHVGTQRPDGYHALMSWVAFAGVGDRLQAERADSGLSLTVDGPYGSQTPAGGDNLAMRAAEALRAAAIAAGAQPPLGARLHLTKLLPAAAGIGGGSADAAATLHLLDALWDLDADPAELMEIGAGLGSDVPVCVYNRSALMSGRGEIVAPGPALPALPVVLCNPGVAVPTAEAFARLAQRRGAGAVALPAEIRDAAHLAAVLGPTGNDLEAAALALAPQVGEALYALKAQPGALTARMSGSGATCFALFAADAAASAAAIALKRARPGWWIAATRLDC